MNRYLVTLYSDGDVTIQPDKHLSRMTLRHEPNVYVRRHWSATGVDEIHALGQVIAELHKRVAEITGIR